MGYSAKVGSFNIDPEVTVGNTQSITDVGFEPKIVMLWWSGSTATGDEVAGGNINIGFGAAIDSTHRFCIVALSLDALATSDSYSCSKTTEIIRVYTNPTTIEGIADFSAMTADGFDIIIDDQFAQAYRINYLALGGDDLTNVFIGNNAMPVSVGNYNVEGIGFQPDAIVLAKINGNTSIETPGSSAIINMGMATSATNQGAISIYGGDNLDTTDTIGYGYSGEVLDYISPGAGNYRESFVEFIADGFTLYHAEGAGARYYHYIALKGGQYSVGNILTRTDGNDIAETVGFQPAALLFASTNRAESTVQVPTDHARLSIGAATSTTNRATQAISDEDNLADSETAHANYDTAVYAHVVDDDTAGIMDLKSIESDGFTCVMDENDASACWVTYLAIGAAEGEGGCVEVITATVTETASIPVNVEVDVMCDEGGEPI